MKPITIAEALEQNPMVCKTWEAEQLRLKREEDDIIIRLINDVIARNIHKLNNGENTVERIIGLNFENLGRVREGYKEFKISTLGNSDTICITKR